jgi:hypothetical protein
MRGGRRPDRSSSSEAQVHASSAVGGGDYRSRGEGVFPSWAPAVRPLRKRRGGLGGACFPRAARKWAGRRGWFGALPPGVGSADVVRFAAGPGCGRAVSIWRAHARCAARLGRGASCLADERARRKRARSVADAAPNVRRSAGPSDAIVSSTGIPAMCASGITGRSPWCSRRLGGAPRGRARGR